MTNPPLMWAQDRTRVFVTIKLQDVENENIQFLSDRFLFKGSTKKPVVDYDTELEVFGEILPQDKETKYIKFGRYIQLNLRKKDSRIWWPRLAKTEKKLHHVGIDWEKWIDDEDDAGYIEDDGTEIPNAADCEMTSSSDEEEENTKEGTVKKAEENKVSCETVGLTT